MFQNDVLRRKFGPKEEELTGGWGKLHNMTFINPDSYLNVIGMIKSRRM
jgi:hypothetical protein